MNEEIQVSICCMAYNHEKYIRRCLDGFLMQKGVSFEVLIHDDASTDDTAKIVKEYEERYPSIVKPIYQKENQYSKGVRISEVLQFPCAKGKYIALCEGDDYWVDEYKLKKQFDALETNPECKMCVCKVQQVYENEEKAERVFPEFDLETGVIEQKHFFDDICNKTRYPFQTSSYFFNAEELKKYSNNLPSFTKISGVGDIPYMLYFALLGGIYYINECMSCYRVGSKDSWNSLMFNSAEKKYQQYRKMLNVYEEFERYSEYNIDMTFAKNICAYPIALYEKNFRNAWKIILDENRVCKSRKERMAVFVKAYLMPVYKLYQKVRKNER